MIKIIVDEANLEIQCVIMCYDYLIRCQNQIPLLESTWKSLILVSLLIAQKVYNDISF
jgi:hypothetical protein